MKMKRIALIFIMLIAILVLGVFNTSNAATGSKYLGIKMLRESGFGYKALEKNVWKIVETNSSGTSTNYDNTIYCLKGGPGFGSSEFGNGTPTVREYTRYFDMKDPDSIPSQYQDALPDVNSNTYKALLWLLENVYVAPASNASSSEKQEAEEYRELLLENADLTGSYLTDDDIDAVQQLAVWHFTNDDEFDAGDAGNFEFWINAVSGQDSNYNPLSDEIGEGGEYGWDRAEEAQTLYRYLINTATEKAPNYEVTVSSQPYQLAKLTQTVKTQGSNYIIGPFRIDQISDTEATLEAKFTNSTGTIKPTLQDASGKKFNNIKETIGKDFYIVVPNTTNIDEITFEINGIYFNTEVTYWSVEGAPAEDQPVAIVDRTKEEYSDSVKFVKPEDKIFDLALRKFINSINGVEPTESRVPQISSETLEDLKNENITTAEKIHPKNPLTVKTGDSVIYTIRVYNEGEIDGIVTEITDYLPDGLKLKDNSSINTQNGWTSADGKTITTNKLQGQIIPAFDGTTLNYLDVQIECEVTAKVTSEDIKLKNIAEITGATNSDGEEMIDRDSTPDNVNVPGYGTTSQEDDDDFEDLIILGQYFDLALRKFIVQVNDTELKDSAGKYLREPEVDLTTLKSGNSTTATYNHPKEPVQVAVGDEIIYTLRVYNEGQIDGYVNEITDYLPANLEFVNDEFNAQYGWKISEDGRTVTTDITSPDTEYSASRDTIYQDRKSETDKVILNAFDGESLDYIDVKIKVKVKESAKPDEKLTNIAEITKFTDSEGEQVTDRDSTKDNVTLPSDSTLPNYKDEEIARGDKYIPGQEDDDDFEKVVIEKFDLALRKFITGVNEEEITNRVPVFSIEDGKYIYTHTKEPVEVATGDTVIYTLRIYNEGDIAGYAEEVKDDVPEGLEFLPENTTNINYRWVMYNEQGEVTENPEEAVSIRTDYLSKAQADETGRDNLIDAFAPETMEEPDYKEVRIAFKVTMPNTSDRIIINTAEISEDANEKGEPVEDIDSTPDNDKDGEDDIDIEKVKVKYFDLALRKFITGVNEEEITNRVPVFSIKDGKYTYTHPKDPVEVANGDTVIYTLRIFNEGNQAGYAEEVKDDLPEGLEFLPENSINTEYRWVMYNEQGEVTENVAEAVSIRTDYLSKAQEEETGRDNLLKGFDTETMTEPDSRDLKIAFKVTEPNTSDRIIINTAEISNDSNEKGEPVDDIDSTPDNNEDGEDDIDIEKIKVSYFDLALRKIISKVTMTLDGKTTVEETNHKFEDDPEEIVKVELGNHKINDAVIKFTYQIRITNEGNKAGYALEVKDYIPKGLEFIPEDNEKWKLSEDGKTITTDQLKDTLLEPGDSAIIEVTFKWINGHDNLGVKTNWAEISKDSDDDIDSTPDNFKEGEDDIDKAEVVLSIVTGVGEHYIGVIAGVITILGIGIVLIKKFVL